MKVEMTCRSPHLRIESRLSMLKITSSFEVWTMDGCGWVCVLVVGLKVIIIS